MFWYLQIIHISKQDYNMYWQIALFVHAYFWIFSAKCS